MPNAFVALRGRAPGVSAVIIGLVRSEKAEDRPQALRYVVPSTNTHSPDGPPLNFLAS